MGSNGVEMGTSSQTDEQNKMVAESQVRGAIWGSVADGVSEGLVC